MRLLRYPAILLLALPLAACAADRHEHEDEVAAQATVKAALPEVRYYVIADT